MLSTTIVTKATPNPITPVRSTPSRIEGDTTVNVDTQHEKEAPLYPAAPVQLSLHTAELVRIRLEQDLLREEARQSTVLRQMGWQRDPAAYTSPSGLDELAKSTISAFIRANKLSIAQAVRRFRNETNHDSRPNKALDPARLMFLLKDYPHLSTLLEVVNVGVTPVWTENEPRSRRTHKNHGSFQRYLKASLRSIRMGQDTGRYLVVDADILDQWQSAHCSPFGAVEKGDVDPLLEIRLIHDLSYPDGTSTNDCLEKSCLPEIEYAYVTALAIRIEYLAINYPAYEVRILKGDVKGAYRHLMTNANHVHRMAGLIRELNTVVIDLAAPFGWSGSPKFYGVFGRAISWLVSANAPSTVANSADSTPFFGYEWVDDHVMIEPDVDDRLQLAEATIRHAMLAILGPRSVNETKFSSWETRLTVLGLTWDTKSRTVSIPQGKIDKGINRIDAMLSKGAATQTELNKVLGSLRYISTYLRSAKPFFQRLQSAATRWPRFGRNALTEAVVMDLRWFLHILRDGHLSELPLSIFGATPVPDFHLYMDASDTGLAVLHPARNEFLQVRFDAGEIDLIESGALSINVRQHLCIALSVWTWGVHMAADSPSMVNHIRCWSDNTSAVAWSNRLASPCNEAQEINRAIGLEAVFNIRMSAAHLPGATNRMADAASRAWSSSSTNLAKDLQDVLFKLQAESLAPTSTVKYSSTWKQWEAWCTIMQFSPWLPDNRVQQSCQLALFAVYCWRYGFSQSGQGNSASTILSKISHLSWNHQINLGYSVGFLRGHKLAIT